MQDNYYNGALRKSKTVEIRQAMVTVLNLLDWAFLLSMD